MITKKSKISQNVICIQREKLSLTITFQSFRNVTKYNMVNCRTSLYLFVLLTHHSFFYGVVKCDSNFFLFSIFFYVFHYFVFKRNCAENVLVMGNFFSTSSSLCFDYQNHFHKLHAHQQQSTCAKFTQICKMKMMIMVFMMK